VIRILSIRNWNEKLSPSSLPQQPFFFIFMNSQKNVLRTVLSTFASLSHRAHEHFWYNPWTKKKIHLICQPQFWTRVRERIMKERGRERERETWQRELFQKCIVLFGCGRLCEGWEKFCASYESWQHPVSQMSEFLQASTNLEE
jgi:hypothetical protein